jgi:aconitate hydratase
MKAMWTKRADRSGGAAGLQPERQRKLATTVPVSYAGRSFELKHGDVVIAAITSCTNTSNPSVMVGAGLLAKKAVQRGLDVKPWVKSSLAPGSKVVTSYLDEAGLTPYLEALNFHTVGYGCTTCIGNSGPLPEADQRGHQAGRSGGSGGALGQPQLRRAHQPRCAGQLPGFAAAGRSLRHRWHGQHRPDTEPLGYDPNGQPVFLRDIWPSQQEMRDTVQRALKPEMFREQYANVFTATRNSTP